MNVFLNKITALLLSVVFSIAGFFGLNDVKKSQAKQFTIPDAHNTCEIGEGRVCLHDPSIFKSNDGQYYLVGSHGCTAKSDDLISWSGVACSADDGNRVLVPEGKTLREVLAEPFGWTDAFQSLFNYEDSKWESAVWAADVIYNKDMGEYCYYACSSVWATPISVIWFGTSDNAEGPFEFESTIVYSGFNKRTKHKLYPENQLHYSFTNISELMKEGIFSRREIEKTSWFNDYDGNYNTYVCPNAIDPTVFYDKDGNLFMVYGSYSAGIFLMPLDEKTGLPDYKYMRNTDSYDIYFGKQLLRTNADTEWTGEGPYIAYDSESDYYYLYVTYGGLNALGGYNIREYRSKTVDGPYLDAAGNSALDANNTGLKLFGNYNLDCLDTAYLASGHSSSIIDNDGKMFQVYHTRFNNGNEGHQVRVHQMARTENGWAVVLPFEYSGETIENKEFSTEEIYGEYEFINHGSITNGCEDWNDSEKIISPTQTITLNGDGTVSGLKVYSTKKNNTALSYKDVCGTWEAVSGSAYARFVIDGVTFEGVFCKQKNENPKKTETLVFSAAGNNNECIWGIKK